MRCGELGFRCGELRVVAWELAPELAIYACGTEPFLVLEDYASLSYTTVVGLQLLMLKRVGDTSLVWYWLATRLLEWVSCECKSTYALLPSTCTLAIKVLATKQLTNAYLVSLVNATRTWILS